MNFNLWTWIFLFLLFCQADTRQWLRPIRSYFKMPFIENSSPILANYTSKDTTFPVVVNSSGAFIMRACADEIYALDPARGRRASGETNQKHYQYLRSNASTVWNFSARFSVVLSHREMLAVFSRYLNSCLITGYILPVPTGWFFWFFISRPMSLKRRFPFNKELIAKDFMLNQTRKNGNIWWKGIKSSAHKLTGANGRVSRVFLCT